ncbi:DUF1631 family protein [Arhodomonas sp. SL1]|uniref:DUF1631 family protein n=1 Tax=Arhodomonas sp. SL1 TaxID=3425691 RepID=UPI003F8823A7
MGPDDKVVYLRGGGRRYSVDVMEEIRHLATERLVRAVTRTLDRSDDALFERADGAGESTVQESYFTAMRELRLQRRRIVARYRRSLEGLFRDLARGTPAPLQGVDTASESDELALVDDHRLEEEVAVESIGTRLQGHHRMLVEQVEGRLRNLVGAALPPTANPLRPQTAAIAFSLSLEGVEVALAARLILYKLFERALDGELPRLLKAVDGRLEAAGAEVKPAPEADQVADTDESPPYADPTAAAPEVPPPQDAQGGGEEEEDGTGALLQRLIRRAKRHGEGTGTGRGPTAASRQMADARTVLRALAALQLEILDAIDIAPADIKARVNDWLERQGQASALQPPVDDTIDLVGMLFENLLSDPRLSPALRAVIARLQVPVLRVALRDRALFDRADHPARQLINELGLAAAGWTEPADPPSDPLYAKAVEVVERVVARYREDVDVFDRALRDLRAFLERERERARVVEQRTRQTAEGNLRVEMAREAVQRAVDERLAEGVPPVVERLLGEAWFRVMFITAVREGEDSEAWQRQLRLMDELVWSVRPKREAGERQRMLQVMPQLLQDLREGLNGIMYNPHDMTELFRELEAEHLRCLDPDSDPPGPASGAGTEVAQPEGPDGPAAQVLDPATRARLEAVPVGSWFELRGTGEPVRGKLSARLNEGDRFVFVNRSGFRVAEYSATEMAAALRDGEAVELTDADAFDYALEQVIEALKENSGG